MTGRRGLGSLLATVGALFVTSSAYLDWFGNRTATDTPFHRLYETSLRDGAASYWRSIALPLAIVTVLAAIGLIGRSRFVFFLGWLVGAATLVLFVVMTANDDAVDFAFDDLQGGAWQAIAALAVMLLGILIMGGGPREAVPEETVSTFEVQTEADVASPDNT